MRGTIITASGLNTPLIALEALEKKLLSQFVTFGKRGLQIRPIMAKIKIKK